MQEDHWKSNGKVVSFPIDLYRAFLCARLDPVRLHDGTPKSPRPRERFLQRVWQQQRIRRLELATAAGAALRVLHPGFWNRAAGPDFRDAVLQFAHGAPIAGDVEIDLDSENWRA